MKNIKLIIYDFDGVMTDNMVYVDSKGVESVRCCRADGLGIDMIRKMGIEQWVVSTETNDVVGRRCDKLPVEAVLGCVDKTETLIFDIVPLYPAVHLSKVMFVGNDINDLEAMKLCGYSACPSDAHEDVKKECNIILKTKGGHGVVRELADLLKDGAYETIKEENYG